MSRIILGWQLNRPLDDARIHALTEQISNRYQPLFLERLRWVGLWHGGQGLLHFDVPHNGDLGLDRTDDRMCCLTGRPTATREDSGLGIAPLGAGALYNRLVTSAAAEREDAVRWINPPFTLCWFDRQQRASGCAARWPGPGPVLRLAHRRCPSSSRTAVGPFFGSWTEVPRIDAEAWKYWFSMGWFPGTSTPLRNVRALDSGERIVGDSRTVSSSASNALSSWIQRRDVPDTAAMMTRAADTVRDVVRGSTPSTNGFEADLTGGLDSRAICSVLIKDGLPCSFYTGGASLSPDVVIARRISRRFRLDWTRVGSPDFAHRTDPQEVVATQFDRMTLWAEGLVEPTRFQHFQAAPSPTREMPYLGGGSSEISRGHYYHTLLRHDPDLSFDLDRTLETLTQDSIELLADRDATSMRERIRQQLGEGATHGVGGWALLDYFYLRERTRRWQAAHMAANLFDVDILPFINIDHITLAFAMQPVEKAKSAFQRFIIQRNAEGLLRIPLTAEVSRHPYFVVLRLVSRILRLNRAAQTLNWADYFRRGGKPAVDQVLTNDSPLWEIVDRGKARKKWSDFMCGRTEDVHLPLGLLAFSSWYSMTVEETVR